MDALRWAEICVFMGGVWGREVSAARQAAGWALVGNLPNQAVESAIKLLADEGREQAPSMSVVYNTARLVLQREPVLALPAGPGGDVLSADEHRRTVAMLRSKNSREQLRRADALLEASRDRHTRQPGLAKQLLLDKEARALSPDAWDERLLKLVPPRLLV